jgi:hypothetical protein
MLFRKFVCYLMVFAIGIGSVGDLYALWWIHSIVVQGTPLSLTSSIEVDLNRHWEYKVQEKKGFSWFNRGQWQGSAHPTIDTHLLNMTRNHAALTNNPALCRTQLYDLGPVGPPQAGVLQQQSMDFNW